MQPYTISPRSFFIHDRPRSTASPLNSLFQDSHAMFKLRIQHLGSMTHVTTEEDSETLRLMLETLIAAKRHIQTLN